jgi:large subunit ribosomal protein L29
MKPTELVDKTDAQLRDLLKQREDDVISFRLKQATGIVENVHSARLARKDIARIKTVLRERELKAKRG